MSPAAAAAAAAPLAGSSLMSVGAGLPACLAAGV